MPTIISDQINDDETEHSPEPEVLNQDGEPELWNINDAFRYAPEKPNDNSWTILLKPLLEKDQKQCNVWKDEVENLLIFAGLFSAVVTSFIIESYRNLQPDPNDAIIGLLSRIATSVETSGNNGSSTSQALQSTFVPTSSDIRVNVLWLTSLVLSLTTVLIGIICLQWLREHQSYPSLSPKEAYALLHMRTQSLREWHVPRIFRALPLLLQAALVLFLLGLIEFLSPFGKKIVIPVSIIIGLTLFFLLYTSLYPAIEGIILFVQITYFRLKEEPPTPCPYKSPQAYISLNLAAMAFRTFHRLHTSLKEFLFSDANVYRGGKKHIIGSQALFCIRKSYDRLGTWTEYDSTWLSIRDAYGYSIRQSLTEDRESTARTLSEDIFPMFDLVRSIIGGIHNRTHKNDDNTLSAEYYCISEVSEALSVTRRSLSWQDFQPQNDYFQDLLAFHQSSDVEFLRLSNVLRIPFYNSNHSDVVDLDQVAKAFHHENLHILANRILQHNRNHKTFLYHRLEIKLRLLGYFHLQTHGLRFPLSDHPFVQHFPPCLWIEFNSLQGSSNEPYEFYWQLALLIRNIFGRISEIKVGNSYSPDHRIQSSSGLLYQHFPHLLRRTRRAIRNISTLWSGPSHHHPLCQIIVAKFDSTFQFINEHLQQELSHPDLDTHPSLLFYVASLYVKALATIYFDHELTVLLETLKLYKQKTIDLGIYNSDVERLLRYPAVYGPDVFSQEWWKFLNLPPRPETTQLASDNSELLPRSV